MRRLLHGCPARARNGGAGPRRVRRPPARLRRRVRGRGARLRIVAHRACPQDAPENSLAGIRLAAELGADAVEVDVRLARGRVPVLLHDRTEWRTARRPGPVRLRRPARLLTLADALAALPDGLGVAVDVKEPRAMAATLEVLGTRPAMVWCRDPAALCGAASTGAELALLRNTVSTEATRAYLRDAVDIGAHAVSLHERAVTPEVVAEAHDLGLVVYAWALRPAMHEPLVAAGVDGLVTDWPGLARRLVPRDGGPRTAR